MDTSSVNRVAVVGMGLMGPGIAQAFASGGRRVTLVSRSADGLARGRASIEANLGAMEKAGLVTPAEAERTLAYTAGSTDLDAAAQSADLVVESVLEDLPLKRSLFARLDRVCPPGVVIASDTSGLPISAIASEMEHPERAATTHFWNPPHLMPLVEIVKGQHTSEETLDLLRSLLLEIGKRPVVVRRDVAGQLGNRIFHAMKREAMYIVQEGIASAEDVDTAMKTGLGLRMPVYGPLEHTDAVGVDLNLAIHSYLYPDLCNSVEPLPIEREMGERGDLGVKTGRGFYDWTVRDPEEMKRTRDEFLMARIKDLYPPRKDS